MLTKLRSLWSDPPQAPQGEHLATHLRGLFTHLQINCVIDVGASRGQYGQLLRSAGFQGHIFSFEPFPKDYATLQSNAASDPNWHVQQTALGHESGELNLNIFNDPVYNSFLEPTDYILAHGPYVERQMTVPVVRLDDVYEALLASVSDPHVYLKVDTQGYDQFVFQGAVMSLTKVLALQTELSVHPIYQNVPSYLEMIGQLNERGFDLTGLFPVARDENLRVVEFDCVMVRSSAVGAFGRLRAP